MDPLNIADSAFWFRVVVSVWAWAIAFRDWQRGIVPNELVLPPLMGLLVLRTALAFFGECPQALPWLLPSAIFVILLFFRLRFLGGGSAKFLIALMALFPTVDFVVLIVSISLVGYLVLALEDWHTQWHFLLQCLRERRLPTDEELTVRGERVEWLYALAATIYVWELWQWSCLYGR